MTDIAPEVPAPAKASLIEDFVDILFSPREVFARREKAGYALVMIIVTLLIGGLLIANRGTMQDLNDAEMARGIAEALVATAAGLAVAIPAVIVYNYFTRKLKVVASELEIFSARLVVMIGTKL